MTGGDGVTEQADQWFDGARKLLFVHAHPDDETISTGGTLAGLAAAGRSPGLVTLTRGERGEVVPGPFAGLQGTAGLAPHRETELAAALAMLGVQDHAFLGQPPARAAGLEPRVYEDSGMEWSPDGWAVAAADAPAAALTRAPAVEALNDLLALADAWRADAIVSYDARGGYGHPDHVFAHRAARAVAHGLELPFWEIVTDFSPAILRDGDAGVAESSTEDPAIAAQSGDVEAHDISPWLDRKLAALRAHATQLTVESSRDGAVQEIVHARVDDAVHEIKHDPADDNIHEIVHVGGQREPVVRVEAFRRVGPGAG